MLRAIAERPELVGGILVGLGLVAAVALRFTSRRSLRAAWTSGWLLAIPLLLLTWAGLPLLFGLASSALTDVASSALLAATAATVGLVGAVLLPLTLILVPKLSGGPVPLGPFPALLVVLFAAGMLYPLVLLASPAPRRVDTAVGLAVSCLVLLLPFVLHVRRRTAPGSAVARITERAMAGAGRGADYQIGGIAADLDRLADLAVRAFAVRDSEGVRAAVAALRTLTARLAHEGRTADAKQGISLLRTTGLAVADDPRAGMTVVAELDQLRGVHDAGVGNDVAEALADLALHAADRRGPVLPAALRALGSVGESGAQALDGPAVTTVIDALAGVGRRSIREVEPRTVESVIASLRAIGATVADEVLSLRNRAAQDEERTEGPGGDLEPMIGRVADALGGIAGRLRDEATLAPLVGGAVQSLGFIGEVSARGLAQTVPAADDAALDRVPVVVLSSATAAVVEALTDLGVRLAAQGGRVPSPLHAIGGALGEIGTAAVEVYRDGGPGPEAEQVAVGVAVALGELARAAGTSRDLTAATSLVAILERLGARVLDAGLELAALQILDVLASLAREAAVIPERAGLALEAVEGIARVGAAAVEVDRHRTGIAAVTALGRAVQRNRALHSPEVSQAAITAATSIPPEAGEDPGLARVGAWVESLAAHGSGQRPPALGDRTGPSPAELPPPGSGIPSVAVEGAGEAGPAEEAEGSPVHDLELLLRAQDRPAAEQGRRYAGVRRNGEWEIRVWEEGRAPRLLCLPERVGPLPGEAQRRWRFRFEGFTWGSEDAGTAQLALALVLDALGEDARCPDCLGGTAPRGLPLCCPTCRGTGDHPGLIAAAAALQREHLAHLPADQSWTVTEREIRSWLAHGGIGEGESEAQAEAEAEADVPT